MLLTMQEKNRIEVVQAVMDGRVEVREAGRVLGRSVCQVYRMLKKLREKGLAGLIHGNRGRESARRIKAAIRHKVVALAQGQYRDINDTHLREILEKEAKIRLGRETLRALLRAAGIAAKQKRRRSKYRGRRERKEAFGMLLQVDASRHDWLEGRGRWLTLVGAIDDATGYVWARFEESETTWAYLHLMKDVFLAHGLPCALYSDRHTIFHVLKEPTIIEQLNNRRPLTQFGRAMDVLGIRLIKAWSPQAKGRIERLWGTLQDRLVVALRLAAVHTKEEANAVLQRFLPAFNRGFTIKPKARGALFRPPPSAAKLDRILCLQETRTVNQDHTVSFEGLILQIPPSKKFYSLARQRVEVLQLQDGSVEITCKNRTVARFRPQALERLIQHSKIERSALKNAA